MEDHDERTAARPSCGRSEAARNPGLPADQGPARIRRREAGADLTIGQARLPDPGRHSDHAAGGSPRPGVTRVTSPSGEVGERRQTRAGWGGPELLRINSTPPRALRARPSPEGAITAPRRG